MPSDLEIDLLHRAQAQAVRLERYAIRAKEKIWRGSRIDLTDALADCAECGEVSRRLYLPPPEFRAKLILA